MCFAFVQFYGSCCQMIVIFKASSLTEKWFNLLFCFHEKVGSRDEGGLMHERIKIQSYFNARGNKDS